MESIKKSILNTLTYSDIFDFPLTYQELYSYLHTGKRIDENMLVTALEQLQRDSLITCTEKHVTLKGREKLLQIRQRRQKQSIKKMRQLTHVLHALTYIPTIHFIGVSGSVAMGNAEKNHDIDLFIITSHKKIWITRFFVWLFLTRLGVRRKRGDRTVADTVCANMFLDAEALTLPRTRHNLYTAHELMQMQPAFERNNTYQLFLRQNIWVRRFLAHAPKRSFPEASVTLAGRSSSIAIILRAIIDLPFAEYFAKITQLWYMREHVTKETISDQLLGFHPIEYGSQIFAMYKRRIATAKKRSNFDKDISLWTHTII